MGIGFIVRDSTGKLVVAASQFISASPDLVVSEAIAALRAVKFSRNRGLAKIIMEGDSLQVVNVINMAGTNGAYMGK
jgi:predicted chitinase